MPHRYFADETDLGLGKRLASFLPGEVVYPGHPDLPEIPRGCLDETWLELVSCRRMVVITRDKDIRRRPVQKAKWIAYKTRGFVLTGRKNQTSTGSLLTLKKHWTSILEQIQNEPDGPWMFAVTKAGGLRRVPLE